MQADERWDPIRVGDVILLVDGAAPDSPRLRAAIEARRPVRVELLRRKRVVAVTLHQRE